MRSVPYDTKYEHLLNLPSDGELVAKTLLGEDVPFRYDIERYVYNINEGDKEKEIEKLYFIRPQHKKFAIHLQNKIIVTTTEEPTAAPIERHYPKVHKPDLMPDSRLQAGNTHMIGTDIVYSRNDAFVPVLIENMNALLPEDQRYTLIGDGVGSVYNLTNTKGINLSGNNVVIKLSNVNPDTIHQYAHVEFNTSSRAAELMIMLRDMNQALGRAGGHRWDGQSNIIVLVPPNYAQNLCEFSRYDFNLGFNT